jgi:hypothetical protein
MIVRKFQQVRGELSCSAASLISRTPNSIQLLSNCSLEPTPLFRSHLSSFCALRTVRSRFFSTFFSESIESRCLIRLLILINKPVVRALKLAIPARRTFQIYLSIGIYTEWNLRCVHVNYFLIACDLLLGGNFIGR